MLEIGLVFYERYVFFGVRMIIYKVTFLFMQAILRRAWQTKSLCQ